MDSRRGEEIPFSEIKKIVVFYEPTSSAWKKEVKVGLLFFIYDTKLEKYRCPNPNNLNVESMWTFRKSIWEETKITFGNKCFDILWGDDIPNSDDARKKFEKSISDFKPLEHVNVKSEIGYGPENKRDMLIKEWESQNKKKETKQG